MRRLTRRRALTAAALLVATAAVAPAQQPSPPTPSRDVRPIPPKGIPVPDADRAEMAAGVEALGREIDALRRDLKGRPDLLRLLPDVQIFHNAVRYALAHDEFYEPREIAAAKALLAQGNERAAALRAGDAPWTKATGLLVLGYVSRIDGSVQPYGLVVPEAWKAGEKTPRRLDFFCHGRGEKLTELSFISQRQRGAGEFTPEGAFVLHPYGRYCNANRFAGEVDLFEALDDIKRRYAVDENRIVARGFSMGGAAAWQFATHHADRWAAAAPGAGFSETAGFLRLDAPGKPERPWYERKLWNWYDATAYAVNLAQLPTVAYNGDKDGQKQAADRMEDALKAEGMPLKRVVGPDTGHSYHPESKKEINAFVDAAVAKGRDTMPRRVRFTTWTLRYNRMHWLTVNGLERHWERARVDAERTPDGGVTVKTGNVTRFTLAPEAVGRKPVTVDGQRLTGGTSFAKNAAGRWAVDRGDGRGRLAKVPGLQGPIDDAFLDAFVMVRPTGKPLSPQVGAWVASEMPRAVREWRATFRGEAPVKDDAAVTPADIADRNLVLWGDPQSNAVLAKIAARLPVRWEKDGTVRVGAKTYPAGASVPVLVYPNPLNPRRYVVVNSGVTFREAHYLNNAEQYARLPDWAVLDITTPPDRFAPGRVVDADFFDESWQIRPVTTK